MGHTIGASTASRYLEGFVPRIAEET